MKKNIVVFLAIILMVVGICFSYFGSWNLADITGFALTMFGAGLAAATMWEKRDPTKKAWVGIVGLVLIGAGAFGLGFLGFAKETVTVIISSVFGLVSILAGLIVTAFQIK